MAPNRNEAVEASNATPESKGLLAKVRSWFNGKRAAGVTAALFAAFAISYLFIAHSVGACLAATMVAVGAFCVSAIIEDYSHLQNRFAGFGILDVATRESITCKSKSRIGGLGLAAWRAKMTERSAFRALMARGVGGEELSGRSCGVASLAPVVR